MSLNVDQALKLAKKYLDEADSGAAEDVFRCVLAQFPNNEVAKAGLKNLLSQQDKVRSTAATPSESAVQAIIGLYDAGRLQEAVTRGEQLARQFPNYFEIYNILAAANLGLGRAEETLKNYRKALKINSKFSQLCHYIYTRL